MPPDVTFQAGKTYRLRLMNITMGAPLVEFRLMHDGMPIRWTHVAKDGFTRPAWQRVASPARQLVSIGETYDMQVMMRKPGDLELEVRRANETLVARQVIHVVAPH
jgi:hypothetical protein